MLQIPKVGRKALLDIVEFRENRDPPIEVVEQFKIHDLLLFIGYLREQGVTFESVDELRSRMPNLHRRADDLAEIRSYMKRWRYCGGHFDNKPRHRPNLVITHAHNHKGRKVPYKFNQVPEVGVSVRNRYQDGYSLDKKVFDTELRGLSSALLASLGDTCDEVDFGYMPSVKGGKLETIIPENERIISRVFFNGYWFHNSKSFSTGILACGIDAVVAAEEEKKHKNKLLRLIIDIVDGKGVVSAELVRELRKHIAEGSAHVHLNKSSFSTKVHQAVRNLLGESSFNLKYGSWQKSPFYHDNWFDKFGLEGMGKRTFDVSGTSNLEQLCGDAFVWIYDRSRKKQITREPFDIIWTTKHYLYLALKNKYGSWDRSLITYFGLDNLTFSEHDPDSANVDARRIAEALNVQEDHFYKLAEYIGLPVIRREERQYGFLHREHTDLILERSRGRFEYYDKLLKRKLAGN